MNQKHLRAWTGHHLPILLSACAILSALVPPLFAAGPADDPSAIPWIISFSSGGGIAGTTFAMGFNDKGVVQVAARFPDTRTCFSASEAQVAEAKEALKELNLSGPPKPVHKGEPIPDTPRPQVIVTYAGQDYDLAADYKPEAARKRLFEIVRQLVQQGKQRIDLARRGTPPLPGSIPCQAETTGH